MEHLGSAQVSQVTETNRKVIWGLAGAPTPEPSSSGTQSSFWILGLWVFASSPIFKAPVLEPSEIDHFLKGELDTRPTTSKEHVCQAGELAEVTVQMAQKKMKEKGQAKVLPAAGLALSREAVPSLGSGFCFSLRCVCRRDASALLGWANM